MDPDRVNSLAAGIIGLSCQGNSTAELDGVSLADSRDENEFTGTAGALDVPTYGSTLTLYRDGQAQEIDASGYPPMWQAEWQEFLAAVAENREPSVNGALGRRVIEVAQAMYQSSAERRLVELPTVGKVL